MSEQVYSGQLSLQKTAGLQTAWLLATLGSKMNSKKNIKRTILQVSIPQVCNDLIEVSSGSNIRYSSSLLYGISLMYKSQMNYFLNDISMVKTRLKRNVMFKSSDSYNVEGKLTTIKLDLENGDYTQNPQIFLPNDPAFNINIDLFPTFDCNSTGDEPLQKRRKLEIQHYDKKIFPDCNLPLSNEDINRQRIPPSNLLFDEHLQTIDTFLNRDLRPFDDSLSDIDGIYKPRYREANKSTESARIRKDDNTVDFEFNNEGQLIGGGGDDMEIDNEMMELINFNNQPLLPDGLESIEQRNIVNDNDFQLYTDTAQAFREPQPTLDNSKKTQRNYFKLVMDNEATRISSRELTKSLNSYTESMQDYRNYNIKKDSEVLFKEVLFDLYDGLSPYVTNAYISILGRNFSKKQYASNTNNTSDLNTILRELESITRLQNNIDDFEVGRDVQRSHFLNDDDPNANSFEFADANNLDIEGELDLNELNNSRDIFALSFNGLDGDSRISNRSSQGEDSQRTDHEHSYLQEESIKYAPGAPESDTDATRMNNQLVKFLAFLRARSEMIGETFHSRHIQLSTLDEDYQLKPPVSRSQNTTFSKVNFSKLIPNFSRAHELNEEPINRKLVANSFSSLLALATKNLVHLSMDAHGKFELLSGDKLCIMLEEISIPT